MERYDPSKESRGFWADWREQLIQLALVFKTRPFCYGFAWALVCVIGGQAIGWPALVQMLFAGPGLVLGSERGVRQVDRELGSASTFHELH